MRDFDQERQERRERDGTDRTFKIGGEVFSYRAAVRPEVLFEAAEIEPGTKPSKVLSIVDTLVENLLETDDNSIARWQAIRAREDDPVTLAELISLMEWIVSDQTARPTEAPSLSSLGRDTNGTESTEDSSTAPAAASQG